MPEIIQKRDRTLFLPIAKYLIGLIVPIIPTWIRPNYITVFGFIMSVVASVSFYLASYNKLWFLVTPLPMFLNWLCDSLDGELARQRKQTSDRGFFLDLFLDNLGFTVITLGIAFASYTTFEIWAIISIVSSLHIIMILFWNVLKRESLLPVMGIGEAMFVLSVLAMATFYWDGTTAKIGEYSLNLFDILAVPFLLLSFWELIQSVVELYKQLDPVKT